MTTKMLDKNKRVARMQKKEKDDLGRPLSRHGHWRPRLYRKLNIQLSCKIRKLKNNHYLLTGFISPHA
jgi:hypothetical protein